MVKRVHEVWIGADGIAMFIRGAKGWRENLPVDSKLAHAFEAESRFEAFRIYYGLMGWGEWKKPEGVSDLFFTGDDQHDFS